MGGSQREVDSTPSDDMPTTAQHKQIRHLVGPLGVGTRYCRLEFVESSGKIVHKWPMSKSRTILIALIAVVLGFTTGLFSQFGGAQDVTDSAKYQEVEDLFYETNQRLLGVQKETFS